MPLELRSARATSSSSSFNPYYQKPTHSFNNVEFSKEDERMPVQVVKQKKVFTILVSLFFIIISVIGGTTLGWKLRVKNFNADLVVPGFQGREINLLMEVINVDILSGSMTAFWSVQTDTACDSPETCTTVPDVNIFFDQNLLVGMNADDTRIPSTNATTIPIFRWSPASNAINPYIASVFQTTSLVVNRGFDAATLQNYPFDKYYAPLHVFARQANDNTTVGLQVQTGGIAVGFRLSSEGPDGPVGALSSTIKISRSTLVKTYAIVTVTAVWIITLIFVYATMYSVIGGYPQRVELLAIPVATLFTVTQLRSTMPGAPSGFGAIIDYVALLPCLALMSFCASLSIALMAFANVHTHRTSFLDRFLLSRWRSKNQETAGIQDWADRHGRNFR